MAQTLESLILINARVGSGFNQVGSTLTALGSIVNGMSQELINFGKESVDVYRDYEKSMKDAEVALSTIYGRNTAELNAMMSQLDASATEWAAATIFHTDDVANAISEMAHAGWDGTKILSAMPAAMELAQAGSLDLSEAVNYIVKSTNALSIDSVDDIGNFIDIWAFAANSSASTIGEFGDAMLRMGSTMRFAANPEELMTLIAVTANAGQTGSAAGTLIRNSMLRLAAPTAKAQTAMAQLGATSEETAGLLEDEALAAANARLEATGFSAFDEKGNLKNVLDIYRELYVALGEVAGGFENIERNEDALSILSSIFPTRTITEALTLIRGASESYDGLYDSMMGGNAEGYGSYAAETMMDTLYGKTELFESKVERLKQVTGGALSSQLEGLMEFGGGFIDSLADMDEGHFNALLSGLEVIAGAGPALLMAGTAFRFLGYALGSGGGIGLGLIGLASAFAAISELDAAQWRDQFGTMDLDLQSISGYATSISDGFSSAYSAYDQLMASVEQHMNRYSEVGSSLSGSLVSAMITKQTLTEEDKNNLIGLADQMYDELQSAITDRSSAESAYWSAFFAGEDLEGNQLYEGIMANVNTGYEEALAEAQSIGQNLRNAITEAWKNDNKIDDSEYQDILAVMRDYNDAMARAAAEAQEEEDFISRSKILNRSQGASWNSLIEAAKQAEEQRQAVYERSEDDYLTNRARQEYRGASSETLAGIDQMWAQKSQEINSTYDSLIMDIFSPGAEGFSTLRSTTEKLLSGAISEQQAADALQSENVFANASNLSRTLQTLSGYLEGSDAVELVGAMRGILQTGYEGLANYKAEAPSIAVADATMKVIPEVDESQIAALDPVPLPIQPHVEGENVTESLTQQGVEVQVDGNTQSLQATIDAEDGRDLLTYVNGDATNLSMSISDQDGRTLVENVTGDTSSLAAAIYAFQGRTITVNIAGNRMFASGGRATTASIFGEAGPEWAIPEEHSERTASLLNAAREASGFTWGDLLSRFGGLNASTENAPTTLVYSPTINAVDSSGVEQALMADKERLNRWYEEKKMRDEVEVYA